MISISIMGCGKVAHHLITAFANVDDVQVVQVFCRKRKDDYDDLKIDVVTEYNALKETDLYILAVSDDSIAEVSEQIPFKNKLVVHTSGSNTFCTLDANHRRGVFYPLQTFSKLRLIDFSTVPFCIEAENEQDLLILEKLGASLGSKTYQLDGLQRKSLHVAAVFVNNFTNHLYKLGKDICIENEIPFEILLPLIFETANKLNTLSPHDAQTGPAKRQDFATIACHLKFLKHSDNKHLYQTLTQSVIQNG